MSVSYYAYMVIGFAIPQKQLIIQPRRRGCSHQETHNKFCGQCGAPTWAQEEQRLELAFQDRKISVHQPNTLDLESSDEELPVLVGVKVTESISLKSNTLETFEPLEAQLRKELERQNIVPTGPFGVHLYRYVSY